ncbi:MAG: hypothetical protein ABSF44_11225 [Candidatus Bathyarchaeia archaeon]
MPAQNFTRKPYTSQGTGWKGTQRSKKSQAVRKRLEKSGRNGKQRGGTGENGKKRNLQTAQVIIQESNPRHKQQKIHINLKPEMRLETKPFFKYSAFKRHIAFLI